MIHHPVNTEDYNIPQIQPKPDEPTQSVVKIPKLVRAVPASPRLEAIKEERGMETGHQQESQQGGIHVEIQATEENLAIAINKNKHCINNYPGIDHL